MKLALAIVSLLVLYGCATPVTSLNDPARSKMAANVAPSYTDSASEVLYEAKQQNGLEVDYRFAKIKTAWPEREFYRLQLIFRNHTVQPLALTPQVAVATDDKRRLAPYDLGAILSQAAAAAGTAVPSIPAAPTSYQHSGMVTNQYGATSYYNGTSTPYASSGGFAGGMAAGMQNGMALGMAMAAAEGQRYGMDALSWYPTNWLRQRYDIAPGGFDVGVLEYPAIGKSPFHIAVLVGDRFFEFVTAAAE